MSLKIILYALITSMALSTNADIKFVIEELEAGKEGSVLTIKPSQVTSATLSTDENDRPQLNVKFDLNASLELGKFTEKHLKKRVSAYIDNTLVSTATIQAVLGPDSVARALMHQPIILVVGGVQRCHYPSSDDLISQMRFGGFKEEDAMRFLKHLGGKK
ncbi:SecDF P1 head subdomain-containing protein [Spartinivicinus poritis]|uniref:SecDF P1 head subdomain domain-containing protein n=1 Tax=Spartinivicinus poritis TaxID=2994640 RepID=A0ABT5U6U9_9GAMM|nr:hypothetical protein [Spartinivicinus sp. A2-2]MDE1462098.1 hypothetical protein [Spartinivicinus sp. A2-2]